MSSATSWLPNIITLDEFGGDWEKYINSVYQVFERDFVESKPLFRGREIRLKYSRSPFDKEPTFWHIIQSGDTEDERTPDFRRCERVPWIRAIIEHEQEPKIKVWPQERNNETRVALWFEEEEYIVILAKRGKFWVLWTAFLITSARQKRRFQKEYEQNHLKPI